MAESINFYGHWFPSLPQDKRPQQQSKPEPAAPTPPGLVGVERPSFGPDFARWTGTAPRWTPPVEEHDVDTGLSPMRQVNAPVLPPELPGFNPATMSAMRRVNDLGALSIETTREAPPVPGVRHAAAIAPLAAPWVNAAQNIWGALPELGEAVKQAAPTVLRRADEAIGKAYEQPATAGLIGALMGGVKDWQEKAPTDPRTFGEELQVAASRGLGGGLLYGAARVQDVTTAPLIAHIWHGTSPTGYGEEVAKYRERRAELQRRIMEEQSKFTGRGGDRRAVNALRSELADLDREMRTRFFNRGWEGLKEQGAPLGQGKAAYDEWNRERMRKLFDEFKQLTHEQKVAEREAYREQAPLAYQFLVDWVSDPLMGLDVLDEVNTIRRINKAMDLTGPAKITTRQGSVILSAEDIARETQRNVQRANSFLGRITPWQPTPESLAHAHVIQSADTVTRISEAARDAATNNPDLIARLTVDPDDNPMTAILRRFIDNPDDADIVALTGGFSQSRQAKRTVILLREMFGTVDDATVAKVAAARAKAVAKVADLEKIAQARAKDLADLQAKGASATRIAKAQTAADKAQQALTEAQEMVAKLPAGARAGDVDFSKLEKIMDEAKGDDLAAVSALAQEYEAAAKRIYATPITKEVGGVKVTEYKYPSQRSTLRKWRGNVSNAVSTMFLGTNPGYAFRNAANNLFTAVVDGVSPIQSADSLRLLWERWGPAPWQTKQGLGTAGDFWKSRERAREYVTSISQPMKLRDVLKAIETGTLKDKLSYTLQMGQNFERYASERIMAHHVRNFWSQVWPKTVRRITTELEAQGFSRAQVQYLQRRLDGCMNPQEVRAEIEKIIRGPQGGTPGPAARPPAPAPTPAPSTRPAAPVAPSPTTPPTPAPAPTPAPTRPTVAPAEPPDARLSVPEDVREQAMRAGGPDAVDAVDEVVNQARTPEEAVARLTVREAEMNGNAELAAAVEELRTDTLDITETGKATVDDLKAYLDRAVEIVRQAQDADTLLIKTTLDAQEGLDNAARDALWQETRAARRRNRLAIMRELDELDVELMPELGFDDEAIVRQREYRAYVVETWDKSDRLINNFWRDKRNGLKGATAGEVYEAMQKERQHLWDDLHKRRNAHIDSFNAEINRAIGKLNTGDVPPQGTPKPPTEPTGPTSPADAAATPDEVQTPYTSTPEVGPAADDAALLPELREPSANAPTSGTVRYVEPEPEPSLPVNIPGDKVQEAMNRAQVVSNYWRGKMGGYKDTLEGVTPGGRSGKAIGGTYREINERDAEKKAAIFEAWAKRGERGLAKDEIDEITAAWKRLPLEVRDPERAARRQAAKKSRQARQAILPAESTPTAPPVPKDTAAIFTDIGDLASVYRKAGRSYDEFRGAVMLRYTLAEITNALDDANVEGLRRGVWDMVPEPETPTVAAPAAPARPAYTRTRQDRPYSQFLSDIGQMTPADAEDFSSLPPSVQNRVIERAIRAYDEGVLSYNELRLWVEEVYGTNRMYGDSSADDIIAYFRGRKPSAAPEPDALDMPMASMEQAPEPPTVAPEVPPLAPSRTVTAGGVEFEVQPLREATPAEAARGLVTGGRGAQLPDRPKAQAAPETGTPSVLSTEDLRESLKRAQRLLDEGVGENGQPLNEQQRKLLEDRVARRQAELDRRGEPLEAPAVPLPIYGDRAIDPARLWHIYTYDTNKAVNAEAAARRARNRDKAAAHTREAQARRKSAAEARQAFDQWATQYPDEAMKVEGYAKLMRALEPEPTAAPSRKLTDFQLGSEVVLSRAKRPEYAGKQGKVTRIIKSRNELEITLPDGSKYYALPDLVDPVTAETAGATPVTAPQAIKTWTMDDRERMVLPITREEYAKLPKDLRDDIHRYFIFSPSKKSWLSKGKAGGAKYQEIARRAGMTKADNAESFVPPLPIENPKIVDELAQAHADIDAGIEPKPILEPGPLRSIGTTDRYFTDSKGVEWAFDGVHNGKPRGWRKVRGVERTTEWPSVEAFEQATGRKIAPSEYTSRTGGIKSSESHTPTRATIEAGGTEDVTQRAAAEGPTEGPTGTAAAEPAAGREPELPVEQPGVSDRGPLGGTPTDDVQRPETAGRIDESGVRSAGDDGGDTGGPDLEAGAEVRRGLGDGEGDRVPTERGGRTGPEPKPTVRHVSSPTKAAGPDFIIDEDFATTLDDGGKKTKAQQNIEAIKLVKQLEREGRLATPEEQAILAKYSGWGGIPDIFDRNKAYEYTYTYPYRETRKEWANEYDALRELLTDAEYEAARSSTLNAHYTSPVAVTAIWDALRHMGFKGGRTLEPAGGNGRFYMLMPTDLAANSKRVMVELDKITGAIAKHLLQGTDVRIGGYETQIFPKNFFKVVVSNVPFGNYPVQDKAFKGMKHLTSSIHNYFFAKALDQVEPGGVIAFITSRYTLDAVDSKVREYLAQQADLVGAIRLPDTAFRKTANTEVVTDIVFLRKRLPDEKPGGADWINTTTIPDPKTGKPIVINEYYEKNPHMLMGRMELKEGGGMYRAEEPTLAADGRDLKQALAEAVKQLPANIITDTRPEITAAKVAESLIPPAGKYTEGQHVIHNGKLYVYTKGALTPSKAAEGGVVEKRVYGMIAIRDEARNVLRLMVEDADDKTLKAAQAKLNKVYDAFVKKHGPLSARANVMAMSGDPDLPFLLGLEYWDPAEEIATKAEVFSKRTVSARMKDVQLTSAQDALLASLQRNGAVDPQYMANALGKSADDVMTELTELGRVFRNPDGGYELSDTYLSGNVRQKLKMAESAAKADPAFARNVEALRAIVPTDLVPEQITLRMGATSNDPAAVREFIYHLTQWQTDVRRTPTGEWFLGKSRGARYDRYAMVEQWGTQDKPADELILSLLNSRTPTVTRTTPDKRTVIDTGATMLAREKMEKIAAEWDKWWRSHPKWADELTKRYNEAFNSYVKPKYDGSHLKNPGAIPGMAEIIDGKPFQWRQHQVDAIWRIATTPNTLLAHVVGAGKTYTMIASGMLMKHLGIIKKPVYVVPNHLVEQWAADFSRMFPGARVLIGNKKLMKGDLAKERWITQVATGDWHAIIVPYTVFEDMAVRPETQRAFLDKELNILREFLDELKEEARREGRSQAREQTIKDIEKRIKTYEAKIKDLLEAKDKSDVVYFDDMGIDQIFVDEAHNFKNLAYNTRRGSEVRGLGNPNGSQRALDLYMKAQKLQSENGGRGLVLATGTPISNSAVELYTLQRYLQPNVLRDLGIEHFDAWANAFGDIAEGLEQTAIGKYKTVSRLRSFTNYDDLRAIFDQVADVKAQDEIKLPRPALKGGRADAVEAHTDWYQEQYTEYLQERAGQLRRDTADEDNMLKIISEARQASLDIRLIDPTLPENPNGKLRMAADEIKRIYDESTEYKGAQLVFCDMSVPKEKGEQGFSAYDDLKQKLIDRGVPEHEIKFIHDAKDDDAKIKLFNDVNAGRVRVLIGSTEKMGAGTNVQKRLVAAHHLDSPLRWSDIEQREGRLLRPGNTHLDMGKPVEIKRYVSKGTSDEWLWQTIENKARLQTAIMNGKVKGRVIQVDDDVALDAATMKAISSNDPRVLEKVRVDNELTKYEVLYSEYMHELSRIRHQVSYSLPREIAGQQKAIAATQQVVDLLKANPSYANGKKLDISIGVTRIMDGKDEAPFKKAGLLIKEQARREAEKANALTGAGDSTFPRKIGQIYGVDIYIRGRKLYGDHAPDVTATLVHGDDWSLGPIFLSLEGDVGNTQVIHNAATGIERRLAEETDRLRGNQAMLEQLMEKEGQPFQHQEKLEALRQRAAELETELAKETPAEEAGEKAPNFFVTRASRQMEPPTEPKLPLEEEGAYMPTVREKPMTRQEYESLVETLENRLEQIDREIYVEGAIPPREALYRRLRVQEALQDLGALDSEGFVWDDLSESFQNFKASADPVVSKMTLRQAIDRYMRPTYGIVSPGTPQAQDLLNRIFRRSAMSTGAGRIASAGAMQPVWGKLRNHLTGPVDAMPSVTPDQARLLRELVNKKIVPNMVRDKAAVANLATQMRNFALGDYADKRMIHEWLAYVMPWSYWYAFTYPNWAQRLATNPSWVSNYARYKAALAKANREYYKAVIGDKDAEMPEYWEDQIRVPFADTQLYFDLERTLMPLQALLNDFESRTRNEAPGGKFMHNIGEWGPSLHPLITWAYAAWLSSQGYREASDEWVGYLFPWSRALKGATALAREHIPALQGIIPAGGFTPEQLALQNVKGGDTWERRRIGYALYTLWKEGRITEEQFQDAAYKQSGEAWDMARQAEAVKRAPGNLGSYLLGAGFKARDMSDIEIDRMNKEWAKIWDARYDQGVDESVWRAMLDEFEKKYPFKKAVSMAREPDPTKRLKDYAYSIIDRLPPGDEYYRLLEEAGMSEELLDRFKADKGDTSKWKPYEVKAFQAAIEKMADMVGVPTEAQKAEYDQYWTERDSIRAAVEKATGHTYAEYQTANDEYNADGADKKAVLKKYPWLKAGWDASDKARAASPTYQKYNPATGKETKATQSELAAKYEAAEKRFGPQVAGWADEYSALPKMGTARAEWRKANPEKWAQVSAYYDFIYGDTRTGTTRTGSDYVPLYKPRSYGGGGRSYGTPYTPPAEAAPPTPSEPPAYEKWTAEDLGRMVQEERTDDPAFDTFVGLMFGGDVLSLASRYYSMSAEERAAWIAANPQLWARLLKFLLWLMKQTGVKSDYARLLASIPGNAPNVPPVPPSAAPPTGYGVIPTPPPVPIR